MMKPTLIRDPQTPESSGSSVTSAPRRKTGSKPPQQAGSWMKTVGLWTGGITLVGLIAASLRPSPLLVEVAYVEQGSLQITIDEEGRTRVKERFVISAPVTGRLQRIEFEPGDPVTAGERLAQIDPLPFEASIQTLLAQVQEWQAQQQGVETLRPKTEAIAQARSQIALTQALVQARKAEVDQAAAALEQAQRERQRAQDLEGAGVLAREERELAELEESLRLKEWETAQQQMQAAQAQVAMAEADLTLLQSEQEDPDYLLEVYGSRIAALEAELTRLQDDAARTEIRAPVGGQILRVWQESTQVVTAGTPLLEIGDPQDLELVVDVLSQDALQIQPGDPVWIDLGAEQTVLAAEVIRIEPAAFTKISALGVEEQRVNVIADLVDPESLPLSWGDGYRLDLQIGIWEASDVLKVPTSALFRCDGIWCVFTVVDERAQPQPVEIGPRNDQEAVVVQGLSVGDPVILYPSEQVEAGIRVDWGEH